MNSNGCIDRQRGSLLTELTVLVDSAQALLAEGGAPRMEHAVARWSRTLSSPSEALQIVAELREGAESPERCALLERVGQLAADAVADRLVRNALTDPLTGLATRARLTDAAEQFIAAALRRRSPVTVAMLDVDGLKAINDGQGHAAGDAAIAAVGKAIGQHVRKADRAFRYGGDEFVVFLPDTTARNAAVVMERIAASSGVALSYGLAEHTGWAGDTDVQAWISRADDDLYRGRSLDRSRRRPSPGRRRGRELAFAPVVAMVSGWLAVALISQAVGASQAGRSLPEAVRAPAGATLSDSSARELAALLALRAPAARAVTPAPVVAVAPPAAPVKAVARVMTPAPRRTAPVVPDTDLPRPAPSSTALPSPGVVAGLLGTARDVVRQLL